MLAVDLAAVVLVGGILVLCATTTITALTLPTFNPRWRRRRAPSPMVLAPRSAAYPAEPIALPAAPRHHPATQDDPDQVGDIDEAWDVIERHLEHNPDRLVDLLTSWISSAPEPDDDEENTRR